MRCRPVYLTVLHRLFASGSDQAAETWKESYRIPGAQELSLHQFYRAMGWQGEEIGQGVLGSPCCTKTVTPERVYAKDPAPLKVKEVEVDGGSK